MLNQRVIRWFEKQKEKGLKQSHFAETWGVSKQVISQLSTGKGSVGLERVINILDYDRNLNPRWLVLGDGKMYEFAEEDVMREPTIEYNRSQKLICDELINQLKIKDEQIKSLLDILKGKSDK